MSETREQKQRKKWSSSVSVGGADSVGERWRKLAYWFLLISVSFQSTVSVSCSAPVWLVKVLKCYMLQGRPLLSVIKWQIGVTTFIQRSQAHRCVSRSTPASFSLLCHFSPHRLPFSYSSSSPTARPPARFRIGIFQLLFSPTELSLTYHLKNPALFYRRYTCISSVLGIWFEKKITSWFRFIFESVSSSLIANFTCFFSAVWGVCVFVCVFVCAPWNALSKWKHLISHLLFMEHQMRGGARARAHTHTHTHIFESTIFHSLLDA